MTEQLRTAASPRLCAYLVSARLQPIFIPWQRLWRPTLPSRGLRWYSIIAATANPNMTHNPHNDTLPMGTRRPVGCDYCKSPNLFG
jgi:hypothetical protein